MKLVKKDITKQQIRQKEVNLDNLWLPKTQQISLDNNEMCGQKFHHNLIITKYDKKLITTRCNISSVTHNW